MSTREIIAYAITHAPKGVKGGPYEGGPGVLKGHSRAKPLAQARRYESQVEAHTDAAWLREDGQGFYSARVIRIVRKVRPSRLCDACGFLIEAESRRRAPSEASAVEVLVLAASGPDPVPVVRAAMAWGLACKRYGGRPLDLELKTLEAVDAYRKAGGKWIEHDLQERLHAALGKP